MSENLALANFHQRVPLDKGLGSGVSYLGFRVLGMASCVTSDKMPSVSLGFLIGHMTSLINCLYLMLNSKGLSTVAGT